jgi:superfamily I DNA and/or RNA helicase
MSYNREQKDVPEEVMPYCKYSGENFIVPDTAKLKGYRVIVSTLIMAAKLHNLGLDERPGQGKKKHFDCIIIDECGHCTEPEALAVLGVLCASTDEGERVGEMQQVVLAGDPEQLGPIVRSSEACSLGLDKSLLERLLKESQLYRSDLSSFPNTLGFDPSRVVKLVDCYRCHSEILRVPNELLYRGDLVARGDAALVDSMLRWPSLPSPKFPLIFHGVEGENEREGNSPSWFNISEVEIVVSYVLQLQEAIRSRTVPALSLKDVGIITPYQKQVHKLREALKRITSDVIVGSVEQFQGDERRVIILSTVRSDPQFVDLDQKFNLGFVASPKRFNVSVTRAQALLIVVGSPKVLNSDPHWSQLLWHCVDHGAYVGAQPLPPRQPRHPPPGSPFGPDNSAGDESDDDVDDDEEEDETWYDAPAEQLRQDITALADSLSRLSALEASDGDRND